MSVTLWHGGTIKAGPATDLITSVEMLPRTKHLTVPTSRRPSATRGGTSPGSAASWITAAEICKRMGSHLHLVHAWQRHPSTRIGLFVKEHLRWDARRACCTSCGRLHGDGVVECFPTLAP